ncbi:MAG: hypothetical protein HZA28_08240 [Candidatus Omnitrophica bacterium]|nr:hypothetical protein [Candidatus Omnitrophota bacterium]
MNTLKKILIACVVAVVLAVVAASVYVKLYGKALLEQALSGSLKKEVRFESVAYQFPFGVRVGNVRIEPDFSANEILAQFAPGSLLAEPRRVTQVVIHGGTYSYVGKGESPLRFRVEDMRLEASDILIPLASVHTSFKFWGRLAQEKNPLSGSRVESSGWVDWVKKDMEGTLQVVDPSGHAGLTAQAVSKNNDMVVTGDLKMSGLQQSVAPSQGASDVNQLISGVLSAAGIEIGAKFSFKTKMDDLEITNIGFSGKVIAGEGFEKMFSGKPAASE